MIHVADCADVEMGFAADEFRWSFGGAGSGGGAGRGRGKAEKTFLAPRRAEEEEEGLVWGRGDHLRRRDLGCKRIENICFNRASVRRMFISENRRIPTPLSSVLLEQWRNPTIISV